MAIKTKAKLRPSFLVIMWSPEMKEKPNVIIPTCAKTSDCTQFHPECILFLAQHSAFS